MGAENANHLTKEVKHLTNDRYHLTKEVNHLAKEAEHLTNDRHHLTKEAKHLTNDRHHLTKEAKHLTNDRYHLTKEAEHLTNNRHHLTKEGNCLRRGGGKGANLIIGSQSVKALPHTCMGKNPTETSHFSWRKLDDPGRLEEGSLLMTLR